MQVFNQSSRKLRQTFRELTCHGVDEVILARTTMPHKRTSSWERVRVDLEVYEYVPRDDEQDLGHDEAEREEDLIFVFEQF